MAIFNIRTILVVFSALLLAVICIFSSWQNYFPFWVIVLGTNVADILFHELGHSVFAWIFGVPNLPAILTIFGADQAGGITLMWKKDWVLQILMFGGLIYLCRILYYELDVFFWPGVAFTIFVFVMAITGYYGVVINYMGHGTSILLGGFFLYRALLNLSSRNLYERWLNAFLGFILTLKSVDFCLKLLHDPGFNEQYSESLVGGVTHHDFVKIVVETNIAIEAIAWFTIILSASVITAAFVAAIINSPAKPKT